MILQTVETNIISGTRRMRLGQRRPRASLERKVVGLAQEEEKALVPVLTILLTRNPIILYGLQAAGAE